MYIFVLQWTPALEQPKVSKTTINGPKMVSDPVNAIMLPHGYIFSAFMVAVALGSFLFSEASKRMKLEKLLGGVLLISCLAFLPSLIFPKVSSGIAYLVGVELSCQRREKTCLVLKVVSLK